MHCTIESHVRVEQMKMVSNPYMHVTMHFVPFVLCNQKHFFPMVYLFFCNISDISNLENTDGIGMRNIITILTGDKLV